MSSFIDLCSESDDEEQKPSFSSSSSSTAASSSSTSYPSSSSSSSSSLSLKRCASFLDDDTLDEETKQLLIKMEEKDDQLARQREEEERQTLELLESERMKRQTELESKEYKCDLCLSSDVKLEQMITLSCEPIGHRYCIDCFTGYCKSKISEAQVSSSSLHCPSVGCKHPITIFELQAHLSNEDFEKYERFTLRKIGEDDENCRFCPRCQEWFADIDQENEAIWRSVTCGLTTCGHTFCGRCGNPNHIGTCEDYAKWKKENEEADHVFEQMLAKKEFQVCPKCKNATTPTPGACKFTYCTCGMYKHV